LFVESLDSVLLYYLLAKATVQVVLLLFAVAKEHKVGYGLDKHTNDWGTWVLLQP
jgi:hypothetical protein